MPLHAPPLAATSNRHGEGERVESSAGSADLLSSSSGGDSGADSLPLGGRYLQPLGTLRPTEAVNATAPHNARHQHQHHHQDAAVDAAEQERRRLSVSQHRDSVDNRATEAAASAVVAAAASPNNQTMMAMTRDTAVQSSRATSSGRAATPPPPPQQQQHPQVLTLPAQSSHTATSYPTGDVDSSPAVAPARPTATSRRAMSDSESVPLFSEQLRRELGVVRYEPHTPLFHTHARGPADAEVSVPLSFPTGADGDDANDSTNEMNFAEEGEGRRSTAGLGRRVLQATDTQRFQQQQLQRQQHQQPPTSAGEMSGEDGAASLVAADAGGHANRQDQAVQVSRGAAVAGQRAARGVRIATAEERRVRLLFHNRPRRQLAERPLVVSHIVLDHNKWEQPLCYAPLFFPCMTNAFYSIPLKAVLRRSWDADALNPFLPSVAYSDSAVEESIHTELEELRQLDVTPSPPPTAHTPSPTPPTLLSTSAVYYVPSASLQAARLSRTHPHATREAAPNPFQQQSTTLTTDAAPHAFADRRSTDFSAGPSTLLSSFAQNCRHLLYRCLCVRCALASQAQALQADAKMRSAALFRFPTCSCLRVESRTYSELFCMICLLDALTLGVPCGCCCYQGFGTALYGWHLRFMLRARYRIYAWTALDLLMMCCIPGLAVDQQGAELLLNGVPESPVGFSFMH